MTQYKTIADYQLLDEIGSGAYGKVYKALNIKTQNYFAVKQIKHDKFKEVQKLQEFTMNEIQTLARISNPHIVGFYECINTSNNFYFIYEYCNGGDLDKQYRKRAYFTESEALKMFKQLLIAFTTLIKENIIHRDIKPANILFHNGQVKLADFGFCKTLMSRNEMTKTMVGSPIYMAPDILLGRPYDNKADMWSLACVFYEMLYGECPFEEPSISNLMDAIENREIKYPEKIPVSYRTIETLRLMLQKDPAKRISWDELFQRELTQLDLLNVSPAKVIQAVTLGDRSKQGQNANNQDMQAFLYFIQERNKIQYLYHVLKEIIELNFDTPDLPVILFCFTQYLCRVCQHLKKNLVDKYNIHAFPHLKTKYLYWMNVPEMFEFRSYQKLLAKEIEYSYSMTKSFRAAANASISQSKYKSDPVVVSELNFPDSYYEITQTVLKRVMLNYIEDIKNRYLSDFVESSNEANKHWLVHIYQVLDALLIDDFFENFININIPNLDQQEYFFTLKNYRKADLFTIISNKISYTRNKM